MLNRLFDRVRKIHCYSGKSSSILFVWALKILNNFQSTFTLENFPSVSSIAMSSNSLLCNMNVFIMLTCIQIVYDIHGLVKKWHEFYCSIFASYIFRLFSRTRCSHQFYHIKFIVSNSEFLIRCLLPWQWYRQFEADSNLRGYVAIEMSFDVEKWKYEKNSCHFIAYGRSCIQIWAIQLESTSISNLICEWNLLELWT